MQKSAHPVQVLFELKLIGMLRIGEIANLGTEVFAGFLTALDVVALYSVLPKIRFPLILALWTGILHMIFPFIGFLAGEWITGLLLEGGRWISSVLLFLTGLHLCLNQQKPTSSYITPTLLAIVVSIDTFSVSLSFGMLQLHKWIFLISAGAFAFVFSYIALKSKLIKGPILTRLSGVCLIVMGVLTFLNK
jgi:putative Mn2+ efflux pump MntP